MELINNYIYLVKNKKSNTYFLSLCEYEQNYLKNNNLDNDFHLKINLITKRKINKITFLIEDDKILFAKFKETDFIIKIINHNYEIIQELGYFEDIYNILSLSTNGINNIIDSIIKNNEIYKINTLMISDF